MSLQVRSFHQVCPDYAVRMKLINALVKAHVSIDSNLAIVPTERDNVYNTLQSTSRKGLTNQNPRV